MKIQIKSWKDNKVLYECEADSMKEAVEKAVEKNANLRSANLSSANLNFVRHQFKKLGLKK